ncbi:MAG: hypothetical protein ACI3YK_02420 [Eubacteriales bacterium]
MKSNWKMSLAVGGILCSLLIAHASVGLSLSNELPESRTDGSLSKGTNTPSPVAQALSAKGSVDSEIPPIQTEIILDNEDAILSGPWGLNTTDQLDERLGDNFVYAGGVAEPSTATATWTVEIPQDGWYRIDARWTMHQNRATNAPYTLIYGEESVTVTVNQEQNGGVWNHLQSLKLNAGDQLTVILGNHADEYVVADGIRIALEDGIILDDSEAVFTGDYWAFESRDCAAGRFGSGFWYNNLIAGSDGNATASATFSIVAEEDGLYQIYGWWAELFNRATDTPFTLISGENQTTVRKNQQTDGAVWNLLGEMEVKAGETLSVRIENNANWFIIVDAVKFVRTEPIPLYTITVEADEAGGIIEGKCDGLTVGEVTTLTAVPNEGWKFTGWLSDGIIVCEDAAYTLTITGNQTLTARFEKNPVDKSELESVLELAHIAEESGVYSGAIPSEKKTFAALLESAEQIYQNEEALQSEVDKAAVDLQEFLNQPVLQAADKTALGEAIARAEKAKEDGVYSNAIPSQQRTFAELLSDAYLVYEEEDALQDAADKARMNLTEFLDSPVLPDTDKSDLKLVLEYAEGLNPDNFADTGKDAFTAALNDAKAVYESAEADQDRVDAAMLELLYRTADLRLSDN